MGEARLVTLENGSAARLTANSVLIPIDELPLAEIARAKKSCLDAAVAKAGELFGAGQNLTVRDLNASDMSYTNNIMTETSNATANQWNAMAFGAFTVSTGTVIGIYGLKLVVIHDGTIDEMPISGVRIEVGGARIAQWNVQTLNDITSASSTGASVAYGGITRTPIVVAEDISVTIYEYTETASTVYDPVWLGVAVEKEGRTLKP